MQFKTTVAVLAAAGAVSAQNATANSTASSLCDKYTTALFTDNTGANQLTLLTALVNTVVVGSYGGKNKTYVPGILAPGEVNGEKVNLLPYFNGALFSTNRGDKPVSLNFLDDGGAEPLMNNKPSNGNQSSNQYMLLTHLYQFFGTLLQCSQLGTDAFPAYQGDPSMAKVHQYMDLDNAQNTYFIMQVGLAAKSFGVSDEDITTVANALNTTFNYRCAPAPASGPLMGQLQAICQNNTCPLSPNATCGSYVSAALPGVANSSSAGGAGNASNTAGGSAAATSAPAGGAASHVSVSVFAAGLGLLAFFL